MDFSESDIWWLLSYKRNVNPESKVYFFQPYINDDMKLMIESYGVETPSVLFEDTNNINEDFINYYNNIFQNSVRWRYGCLCSIQHNQVCTVPLTQRLL